MNDWFSAVTELPCETQWVHLIKKLLVLKRTVEKITTKPTNVALPAVDQSTPPNIIASPKAVTDLVNALIVRRRLLPAVRWELPVEIQLEICKHIFRSPAIVSVTATTKPGLAAEGHVVNTVIEGKQMKLWVFGNSLLNLEDQQLPNPVSWSQIAQHAKALRERAVPDNLRLDSNFQTMLAEEWYKQSHFLVYHVYELADFLHGTTTSHDYATARDLLRHISINLSLYDCHGLLMGRDDICSLIRGLNNIRNKKATIDFYIGGAGPFSAFRSTAGFQKYDEATKASLRKLEYRIAPRLRALINSGYVIRIGRSMEDDHSTKLPEGDGTRFTLDAPAHLHQPTWYYPVRVLLKRLDDFSARWE